SFALTIIRDSFNIWSVDFLKSVQTGKQALEIAVGQSIGFDLGGAVSVLVIGVVYGRVRPELRRWLVAGILLLLAGVVASLPGVGRSSPVAAAWLVAVVGLLLLGPYSLLTGVFAVE